MHITGGNAVYKLLVKVGVNALGNGSKNQTNKEGPKVFLVDKDELVVALENFEHITIISQAKVEKNGILSLIKYLGNNLVHKYLPPSLTNQYPKSLPFDLNLKSKRSMVFPQSMWINTVLIKFSKPSNETPYGSGSKLNNECHKLTRIKWVKF